MATAGSPGNTYSRPNAIIETMSNTGIMLITRRRRYWLIALLRRELDAHMLSRRRLLRTTSQRGHRRKDQDRLTLVIGYPDLAVVRVGSQVMTQCHRQRLVQLVCRRVHQV